MGTLQNVVQDLYEKALTKENNSSTREELRENIQRVFDLFDEKKRPRPKDFNVTLDDNGDLAVYFSKDIT